ncbi:DUF1367 family protein [Citrobacter amalonaticus]|uniref:DUF1367 family protein n=1 Tax=Citrobacter amalonaticus TaxID=35703 RepID=UPI00215C734C|nr:DUF1367 family protein [Citrobacter amalonaticus]MCR9028356.1 DUF1367 family protein [Citrobacter amalonaticus]
MAHIALVKNKNGLLEPANVEAGDFLQHVKTGVILNCDVKRARNYLFHKKYFSLLKLGFDYWTPSGGAVTEAEKSILNSFIRYQIALVGNEDTLHEIERAFIEKIASRRVNETALFKSFEVFREWATVEAGFYDEYIFPDNTKRREARSVSFSSMSEDEFNELYKSTLNVLWNHILFKKFKNPAEAENVASQLLEYAA